MIYKIARVKSITLIILEAITKRNYVFYYVFGLYFCIIDDKTVTKYIAATDLCVAFLVLRPAYLAWDPSQWVRGRVVLPGRVK